MASSAFVQAMYCSTVALGKKCTIAGVPTSSIATRPIVNGPSIHMVKLSFLIANSSTSWTCVVKRLLKLDVDHIDLKDAFAAEMCIGMTKCSHDIPDRNNYWNKVKICTREQAISLKPHYINEENWQKLVDHWCEDHSYVCDTHTSLFNLSIRTSGDIILN